MSEFDDFETFVINNSIVSVIHEDRCSILSLGDTPNDIEVDYLWTESYVMYECMLCNKRFDKYQDFLKHMKIEYDNNKDGDENDR